MNADYVEQDLVLTQDNIPIVLHDIHIGIILVLLEICHFLRI
jgi:glycerophosphoryl diester phosphodiesterase